MFVNEFHNIGLMQHRYRI